MSEQNQTPETEAETEVAAAEVPHDHALAEAEGVESSDNGSESASSPDAAAEIADLRARDKHISALEEEIGQLKDRLLRSMAETENVRKRAAREKEDAAKFAASRMAGDLLSVADNLRRALESVPAEAREESDLVKNLLMGVEGTEREMLQAFERNSIKSIDPTDKPFDPNFHEAMFEVPNSGKPAGTVVQVVQAGYMIHDRLLRPARVGIATGDVNAGKMDQNV